MRPLRWLIGNFGKWHFSMDLVAPNGSLFMRKERTLCGHHAKGRW